MFFCHSWALVRMGECQTYVKLSEEKLIPKWVLFKFTWHSKCTVVITCVKCHHCLHCIAWTGANLPVCGLVFLFRSDILSLLRTYNCYHEGKNFQLRTREVREAQTQTDHLAARCAGGNKKVKKRRVVDNCSLMCVSVLDCRTNSIVKWVTHIPTLEPVKPVLLFLGREWEQKTWDSNKMSNVTIVGSTNLRFLGFFPHGKRLTNHKNPLLTPYEHGQGRKEGLSDFSHIH